MINILQYSHMIFSFLQIIAIMDVFFNDTVSNFFYSGRIRNDKVSVNRNLRKRQKQAAGFYLR